MNVNDQGRKARSLEAIKGSLASLSHEERAAIAFHSPAANRLLDDLAGLVELAESYRDRFGPLALAGVETAQRNPAPISKTVDVCPDCGATEEQCRQRGHNDGCPFPVRHIADDGTGGTVCGYVGRPHYPPIVADDESPHVSCRACCAIGARRAHKFAKELKGQ